MRLHDHHRLSILREYDTLEQGRDHSLDALCNLVRVTFNVPIAVVSLVDDSQTHHLGMAGVELGSLPNDVTFCSRTIEGDTPMLVEDATKDARFADNPFVTAVPGIRFYVGAPLMAPDGSPLGAICAVDTQTRSCSAEERDKLISLATTAIEILGMRKRMKEMRALAVMDGLTGIPNRSGIELEIQKAIAVLERHSLAFSLLYFDVDGFKSINDVRGHAEGDKLLRLIGQTLAGRTRREETSGRIGGDEFVVLLIGAGQDDGYDAAQRIKQALDDAVAREGFPVSFSMGLASFVLPPVDAETALSSADSLLYQAKRDGKNRIVFGQMIG